MLPLGSVSGTAAFIAALSNPRLAGIGYGTVAPVLNRVSDMRSWAASNASMNCRVASRTVDHCEPIDPETSTTSDRSTMRRVAWPIEETVIVLKFASPMNVVGSTAVALMVTVFTPVDASVVN